MGSQPLLRSETCPLSPMRSLEHISVGVSSTKHELIGKENKSISEGMLDTVIGN